MNKTQILLRIFLLRLVLSYFYAVILHHNIFFLITAGTPATSVFGGTSLVIQAPAATIAF